MTLREPVFVGAVGASTPVGRDALSTAAAVRAGISGFAEHPYMLDAIGEPMRIALAPWLDIGCEGVDRFGAFLLPAVEQALRPIEGFASASPIRVGLALCLPSERPGLPEDLGPIIQETVSARFPRQFSAVAVLSIGHAAGLLAIQVACSKIADGSLDACVVAGVESYLAPETLEWLEANDQLHGAGALNNAWGFIPGEGAGAGLLVSERLLERLSLDPLARVMSVGQGLEPNRIKTPTVCLGEGLTAAFREALAGLPSGARVTDVLCDLNGEPYRADEFGFACLRTGEAFVAASDFIAPADCWGDVSAASVPLNMVLSGIAAQKSYAKGPYAFLWASSETGERGAALFHLPARPPD